MNNWFKTFAQLIVTIVAITGLFLTFYNTYLAASRTPDPNYAFAFTNFFSYFTIQSNILVAVTSMYFLLNNESKSKTWQIWEFGALVNITITGIIYHLLLRKVWDPQGLEFDSNAIIHYFVPILFVTNWLLFRTKSKWPTVYSLIWLIYPVMYFVYTIIRGLLSGFYPYPFIDISDHGFPQVLLNAVLVGVFFVAVGIIVAWLSRRLKSR